MDIKTIKIKKTNKVAKIPSYATNQSAGCDLYSCFEDENRKITIAPGKVALIPTGISISIPIGYEVQVRPRSGLALKNSIFVLNSPGTIDSDYRGEIKVILANFGDVTFIVNHHDRIAQMVLCRYSKCDFAETETLDDSERGDGGFGSSGTK
jgi:dUTP pyrophosphatase